MGEIVKEGFKKVSKYIKSPQEIGLVLIILIFLKVILPSNFNSLKIAIAEGIGKFSFINSIIEAGVISLFFLSIFLFGASTLYMILYSISHEIESKTKYDNERLNNFADTMHRFFLGSKIATVRINLWLLILSGFFFVIDDLGIRKYYSIIDNFIKSQANHGIVSILILLFWLIYSFTIIYAAYYLISGIFYRFLYFRLEEEKTKKA